MACAPGVMQRRKGTEPFVRSQEYLLTVTNSGLFVFFFQLVSLTTDEKTNVHFSSLPGQGVIYNVIVWDPLWNTSAAYVPVHTYACSLTALVDNCSSLSKSSRPVCFFYMRSCFQCELVYLTCSDLGFGFCICQQLWRLSNAEQETAYFMAFLERC